MEEQVRPAGAGDAAAIGELEADAREALALQRGGPEFLGERPAVGDWAARVAAPDGAVWVATLDDLVFGYLELQYVGGTAEVRQVYVDPGARELGLGDALLAAAIAAARARGCRSIEGTALPGDRETKNLYERAAITARKIIVAKKL